MKVKVSDLKATIDYLIKENVLDVDVRVGSNSSQVSIAVDFLFIDADNADCTIRCYQVETNKMRRIIKDMVHHKPGEKK